MTSKLDQIRQMTTIVADTGDLQAVRALKPQDCTTNPSIVLKALQSPDFEEIFAKAVAEEKSAADPVQAIATRLTVAVGAELSALVPGRVSTEVDARLSFDKDASVARALELVGAYDKLGIGTDRILIKLASTWEGIQAGAELEKRGIQCNLTLLFSFAQAQACADAGVFLISPFVGRITDWYKAKTGEAYEPEQDPGVLSVRKIYNHYKTHGYDTVVMGASFRSTAQVEALAGCDRLTISPALLTELSEATGAVELKLDASGVTKQPAPAAMSEADFRWDHNEDQMATEKLSDGIRLFNVDAIKLQTLIEERL
ncbi:MAG: transaldolase [Marinosulfonomonas sp.]